MISIIIVNYFVKKELFVCLDSIYGSKPKSSFEVIVVDNDEKKTIEKELKKKFPKVRYIKNDNKGFGQGNNTGAAHAKGEYLFFLNPDTTITKGTIDILTSYLTSNKNTGIVAPILYDMNGDSVPLQGARELTPLRAIFSFSFLNRLFPNNSIKKQYWYLDEWNKKSIKEVESIPGTAFVIRRKLYEQITGFDENFFLYFEENDLCRRVKSLGWKIVMHPRAKVSHALGSSTSKLKQNVSNIFQQSRFYYFKKHFGLLSALLTESVLRFNKYAFTLLLIMLTGFFLRIDRILETMYFIGDQAWFYLSARDMLLTGHVPLVGIASSHPWLHQGALWTYLLAAGFWVGGFSPFTGVYLSTVIDLLAIFFIYRLGVELFSRRVGMLSALLYAVSPLVVANARMPYHTSPIPLFVLLLLYFLYKWINNTAGYFPFIIFTLALLYNLEIATFVWTVLVIGMVFFGFWKRKKWAIGIFQKKVFFYSLLAFIIPMLPMLLYDISHGFPQTLRFLAWVGYKVLVVFGFPPLQQTTHVSIVSVLSFFIDQYTKLSFASSKFISVGILIGSLGYLILQVWLSYKRKEKVAPLVFLLLTVLLPLVGFFAVKTPSSAYFPMLFPPLVLLTAFVVDTLLKLSWFKIPVLVLIAIIVIANVSFLYRENRQGLEYMKKTLEVSRSLVKTAGEKEYTIEGKGSGSQFESSMMHYEYLTWWLGHGPSKTEQPLQFIILEEHGSIQVEQKVASIK